MSKKANPFINGLIFENPTFVQLLGMCPTLAVTTSVINALGMGLSATAVLIASNVVISLVRKFIPNKIRIASYIVVIAAGHRIVRGTSPPTLPSRSSWPSHFPRVSSMSSARRTRGEAPGRLRFSGRLRRSP